MSVKFFADTNILLYSFDTTSPDKQATAKELMRGKPVVSTQVLAEFLSASIKKKLQKPDDLPIILYALNSMVNLVFINHSTLERALHLNAAYRFSYYDSLIVSAALESQVEILYTEDLQHGQKIESLTIVNPFV